MKQSDLGKSLEPNAHFTLSCRVNCLKKIILDTVQWSLKIDEY